MPFPYRSFVINLDRQPERLARFKEWNGEPGLAIERFPGVDGATLDEITLRSGSRADHTRGAIGSALSHKALWDQAIADGRPLLIFEDDAVLREDLAGTLTATLAGVRAPWDIILLGINTDALLLVDPTGPRPPAIDLPSYPSDDDLARFRLERLAVQLYRLRRAFGLCGYLISPRGAARLSASCFPMDDRGIAVPSAINRARVATLDGMLNTQYDSVDAFVCWPPLVLSPNERATSTTVDRRRTDGAGGTNPMNRKPRDVR